MLRRLVTLFGALVLLLGTYQPAEAAISIYYASQGNSYGWCAGYAAARSDGCAQDQCIKNNGQNCKPVVACNSGWNATAFAGESVSGFGTACGMSDAFWARVVALDECIYISRTICWTDATFDARGNTQSQAANHRFDLIYYTQIMLQIRNYDPGDADGQPGGKTTAAVRKFEADIGRTPTGDINDELVKRLYDAVGGGPALARILKRDFLDPQSKNIGDAGYGSATDAPSSTFSEQLLTRPTGDRLLALATLLSSSGTRCTLPALDAAPIGDASNESWNINCSEGWYTLMMSDGSRTIITGKSTASTDSGTPSGKVKDVGGSDTGTAKLKTTDDSSSNASSTPSSDAEPASGGRDVSAAHH